MNDAIVTQADRENDKRIDAWKSSQVEASLRMTAHRVTLTRRHLICRPLVITTNANPSHADALRDLRYQFKAVTGRAYLPRRGDTLTHEVTK